AATKTRDDTRAPHDHRVGADASFDPRAETSSRRRPRAHGGDRLVLAVDRTVDATTATGREPGRQTVRGRGVDQLDGDAVRALLADRRARLGPAGVVERDPQTAAAPVAGLGVELTIELGPPPEALERHRTPGGIAAHDPD